MKKNIVIFLLALPSFFGFSQSVFDKFEDMEEVTSVVINKSIFNLLTKIDIEADNPETKKFINIAKSLTSLNVFTTENQNIGAAMKSTVTDYLKSSTLEELMRVENEEAHVKFYSKPGKDEDHVNELLMVVDGLHKVKTDGEKTSTIVLSLTGDIDLNTITILTKKMNLPEELNTVGKKQ